MNFHGIWRLASVLEPASLIPKDEANLPCEHLLDKNMMRSPQSLALMTCLQTRFWQVTASDPLTAHTAHTYQVPGRHIFIQALTCARFQLQIHVSAGKCHASKSILCACL